MFTILPFEFYGEGAHSFPTNRTRKRTMPMVPEPFDHTELCLHSLGVRCALKAKQSCKFFPNLDISQYRESLSEVEKTELDQRCKSLVKRAITNQNFQPSEFRWEVYAWIDVFSSMLNDRRIKMQVTARYSFLRQPKKITSPNL